MLLYQEVISGAFAGGSATIIGHPLDCVKVHLQTKPPSPSGKASTLTCALEMLRKDGLTSFTRGLAAPLFNSILMNTVMFVVFEEAEKHLPNSTFGALLAGGSSGLAQSCLSTPFDWVKIQSQLRGGSPVSWLKSAFENGIKGGCYRVYSGHTMNMLRESVFTAVYLGIYMRLRHHFENEDGSIPLTPVMLLSATTGGCAWIACYPFDSIKSVQQSQPPGTPHTKGSLSSILGATQYVYNRGGLSSFYNGAGASTLRAVLVTCTRLVAYEGIKRYCSW